MPPAQNDISAFFTGPDLVMIFAFRSEDSFGPIDNWPWRPKTERHIGGLARSPQARPLALTKTSAPHDELNPMML
jgi:hypothetical protein